MRQQPAFFQTEIRDYFTLIELLIVIAMITILSSQNF